MGSFTPDSGMLVVLSTITSSDQLAALVIPRGVFVNNFTVYVSPTKDACAVNG
ncbi:hypothetical protein DPMN_150693 [Dreissena polymorpha]|uniref:Uncharacterized protein n=1 Tax=Dreissena polymorpha TaxID=45954 RepID=A0A9D4J679_DREPO|nr:hypothetical protein DPMN_150693 [Dreissena polymorpha]